MSKRLRRLLIPTAAVAIVPVLWWYGPYCKRWGYCKGCGRGRTTYSVWWTPVSDRIHEDEFVDWWAPEVPDLHSHDWTMWVDPCRSLPFGGESCDCVGPWPPHQAFRYRRELGDEEARDLVRRYMEVRRAGDREWMREFQREFWARITEAEALPGEEVE